MGSVYEVEQEQPHRKVALKVIRGGSYVTEHQVHLFKREIDSLARLSHPSIAAIHDAGRTSDMLHEGRPRMAVRDGRLWIVPPAGLDSVGWSKDSLWDTEEELEPVDEFLPLEFERFLGALNDGLCRLASHVIDRLKDTRTTTRVHEPPPSTPDDGITTSGVDWPKPDRERNNDS